MKSRALLALAVSLAAAPAIAYDADTFLVRFGGAVVAPESDSTSPLGDIARVETGSSLGFSGTWMINPQVGVELLAALPFSHDVSGTGAVGGIDIGSTDHLPPTVTLQWYPPVSGDFQPYVGLGWNYTMFFNESTTAQLDGTLAGNTKMSLTDSSGLAWQVGLDYKLGEHWLLNAAAWKVDIETSADVRVNGAHAATVNVEIDPWVYMVGAGYRF